MGTKVGRRRHRVWLVSGFGEGLLIAACLLAASSLPAAQENPPGKTTQHQVPGSGEQKDRGGQKDKDKEKKTTDPVSCVTKAQNATKTPIPDNTQRDAEEQKEPPSQDSLGTVLDETANSSDSSEDRQPKDRHLSSEKLELRGEENIGAENGRTQQCTPHDRSLKTEAVTPD